MGIDTDDHGRALIVGLRLRALEGDRAIDKVLMRRSSSGRGWHFRLVLKEPVTDARALEIRAALGDCPGRWRADQAKFIRYGRVEDCLFDHKSGRDAEAWRPLDLAELNRTPFWSAKFIEKR